MTQKLLKKLWLRVIVTVMTTAFTGSVWAQTTYALQQVTSVEAGGLYVFEQGGHVMNNACSNSALQTTATYETSGLTGTETYVWTLETATGGYYMKNVNGTGLSPYLNNTSSTNVSFGNNANSVWAFNFQDDNTVLIQNTTNSNRFLGYTNSTSYAYKAYAIANLNGSYAHAIKVYQLVEEGGSGDQALATSITISDKGITNTNIYEGTDAGRLIATVIGADGNVLEEGVVWSGNNDEVATIGAETGIVTLVGAGTVTFTASYAGVENAYKPSSKTYTMTVTNSDPNAPGTEAKPYTVAEARAAIDAGANVTGVYATGIVSKIVTAYNSTYGNISYNISEDGTETADQLQAFRGFSYDGAWFTSADDIQVGDVVVVYGNLKKYNTTYEFDAGNQLVSLDRPVVTTPSITVDPATVNAPYAGTSGTIDVTYNNVVTGVGTYFEWYTDATGATATTEEPNWITIGFDTENNVTYTIAQNDGSEPRTAYMKVWGYYDPQTTVYSDVITFTQNAYVAGCATLNFVWDGGKADIESTAGLSQEGLGNDYNNSPKLKFDSTGDWLMLQFNERASKLTFDIKGNSFSDGTFTVQTSEDGVTFTDLKTYTSFSTITEKEVFDNLDENVRYIKWVYTEKVTGNVALGNISVKKYSADPFISISPITVNVDAVATEGTLDIRLDNITISDMAQFEVRYLTASLESTTQPEWLDVVVAEQDPSVGEGYVVSYTVLDNDGEARSAYFQVYGLDDDGSTEALSQVVTIEQAEYVAPVEEFATLPFVWEGSAEDGKSSLEAMAGVTANGLGTDYAVSNAPYRVKLDGTGDYIQVQTDCQPVLVSLDVKMLGGSNPSTITVQESADGENFADVEELAIEGVQNDVLYLQTASAFDAATRYVRLYFTKGSNVGVGGITIEKEFEEIATVGATGYATYVTKHNVSFPAGVAYIGAVNGNMVSMTAVTAAPKGTPLILKGEGTYELTPASASELADVSDNELKASETEVVADGTQYVLAKPANEPVGFYQATGTIPAGKAYLVVPSSSVKAFTFSFEDDATGIEMVNGQSSMVNDPIFNLAGQRIQKMQKGINIVNGKKILR